MIACSPVKFQHFSEKSCLIVFLPGSQSHGLAVVTDLAMVLTGVLRDCKGMSGPRP